MKLTKLILPLAITAMAMTTLTASAQDTQMSRQEYNRMDSMQTEYEREKVQTQEQNNVDRMRDVREERAETKAKLKEAQRVENDASNAASESKNALRAEKKAQKARKKADKQAKTAKEAREKSDLNR